MKGQAQEVRVFSKERLPDERTTLAGDVKVVRSAYFQAKKRLFELNQRIHFQKNAIEADVRQLEEIDLALEQATCMMANRIFDLLGYKTTQLLNLYKSREQTEIRKKAQEKFLGTCQDALRDATHAFADVERQFWETKTMLSQFHDAENVAWEEKEANARDVSRIIRNENVLFIHAISPHYTPDENSVMKGGTDWETKMSVVLGLEPTLSTSTISEGDTANNMWERVGFILKGGHILEAHQKDAATRAYMGGKDAGGRMGGFDLPIEKRIPRAIQEREEGYNEFVVAHPQVAGLYIAIDEEEKQDPDTIVIGSRRESSLDTELISGVCAYAEKVQLPVFLIKNGVPHRGSYDHAQQRFIEGERLTPEMLLTEGRVLDTIEREALVDEVLEKSPFKVETIEKTFLDTFYAGRLEYVRCNGVQKADSFSLGVYLDPEYPRYVSDIPEGVDARLLIDVPHVDSPNAVRIKYIVANGELYQWRHDGFDDGPKQDRISVDKVRKTYSQKGEGYVSLNSGGGHSWKTNAKIVDTDTYLTGVREVIERLNVKRKEELDAQNGRLVQFYTTDLIRLGYHLYGYAEQARIVGDTKAYEQATTLAQTVVEHDQAQELFQKRIGKNGEFKIVREDL